MEVPRLRAVRRAALLTQSELAERAGVTKGTIINVEHGRPARISTVRKLAAALRVDPSELMQADGAQALPQREQEQ